jgi:hypothetical protein
MPEKVEEMIALLQNVSRGFFNPKRGGERNIPFVF